MPLTLLLLLLTPGVPTVHCTLPAPRNVTIGSFNLEHHLHWLPGPGAPATTHFRVHCLHLSEVLWKPIPWCLNVDVGTASCDLTDSFPDSTSSYVARVQAFSPTQLSNWTLSIPFNPILDTVLGPPQVSVSGCGNCLRLQILPPTGRGPQQFLSRHLLSEFTCWVRRSRDHTQFSLRVSSSEEVLVDHLEPGVEYCVTATVTVNFNTRAVPSLPQCAFTSPVPISTVPVLLSALCAVCFLGVLLCALFLSSRSVLPLPESLAGMLLSVPSQVRTTHTAAPGPLSQATVLHEHCHYPWEPLHHSTQQEEKEEEEQEEDYGQLIWEVSSVPCSDPLLPPQRPQVAEE